VRCTDLIAAVAVIVAVADGIAAVQFSAFIGSAAGGYYFVEYSL
jgi:hypothetical protein